MKLDLSLSLGSAALRAGGGYAPPGYTFVLARNPATGQYEPVTARNPATGNYERVVARIAA